MAETQTIRTYSELIKMDSFEDRFNYLKLDGRVGKDIFGFDRYLNQNFYRSEEWKSIRNFVIIRDNGCDLGMEGYIIPGRIYIHHLNPVTKEELAAKSAFLLDPENLICCSFNTHQAIHYGDINLIPKGPVERKPFDTCPWKL